jgi:hypothetical protein
LYAQYNLNERWDRSHNIKQLEKMPEVFSLETEEGNPPPNTYYQVLVGNDTPFPPDLRLVQSSDISSGDGLANTLAIVEAGEPVAWTSPQDIELVEGEPFPKLGGLFDVGFHAVMCDGKFRSFVKDIYQDEATLTAMAGYRDNKLFRFVPYDHQFDDLPQFQMNQPNDKMRGAIQAARLAASRSQSKNHLRQLALAMHTHHKRHACFPPPAICDPQGKPLLSWRVHLLPYLDQRVLYEEFKLNEPWDSDHNKPLLKYMPEVYASPLDLASTDTFYQVPVGSGTGFNLQRRRLGQVAGVRPHEIRDGLANTLMLVEAARAVPWTKPEDVEIDVQSVRPALGGIFSEGFHASTFHGSVVFVTDVNNDSELRALFGIADGVPFDLKSLGP